MDDSHGQAVQSAHAPNAAFPLCARISYRTGDDTDPAGGLKSTDNTIGLSLVMGF